MARVEEDDKLSKLVKEHSPKAKKSVTKSMVEVSSDEDENEEGSDDVSIGNEVTCTLPKASTSSPQKRSKKKRRMDN